MSAFPSIDSTYRDHVIKGDIHSGAHQLDKAELRALHKTLAGAAANPSIVKGTLAALQGVTPANENYGGLVLNDPTASNNGYYYRSSSAWVKGRGFFDTFGQVTLAGSGTSQTGAVEPGVNPGEVLAYFAVVGTDNTGPLTLSIAGGTARDVVNAAGNALSAGEWTGTVLFFLNDANQYQLITDASAAAAAAASATLAAASAAAAQVGGSGVVTFDTLALAQAYAPSIAPNTVVTRFYDSGFVLGSGAIWRKVTSQPVHPGKHQNANGTWYELAVPRVDLRMFGAPVDGTSFAETAINNAIAASVALKVPCYVPSYTFVVRSTKTGVGAGGSRKYALDLPSNLNLEDDIGRSTIKLADGQSTDASPKDTNIFMATTAIENIRLNGIIFDLNGSNNPISPSRGTGVYGRQGCAAVNITGNSAWVNGAVITHCQFNNTAGTSQIVLAQSENGVSGPLSQNILIAHNKFYDNGLDTDDHSCVFAWAENVDAYDNHFQQNSSLSREGKNWVSFEIHGANTFFHHNTVINFYRGCWIASNFTAGATNLWVTDNVFRCWANGPSLFLELSSLSEVRNVHIARNNIYLDDFVPAAFPNLTKVGVSVNTLYGVRDVFISDNFISGPGNAVKTFGFDISTGLTGRTTENIVVRGNTVEETTFGLYCRLNDGNGDVTRIIEENNVYRDLRIFGSDLSYGSSYVTTGSKVIGQVVSKGNTYVATSGVSNFSFGVLLLGAIGELHLDDNDYFGSLTHPSSAPYSINNSATISVRKGEQLLTGTAAPTSGTWLFGAKFQNYAPTRIRNIDHWKFDGSVWRAYGTGHGATSERPSLAPGDAGYSYYDTTVNKLIIWSGSAWLE